MIMKADPTFQPPLSPVSPHHDEIKIAIDKLQSILQEKKELYKIRNNFSNLSKSSRNNKFKKMIFDVPDHTLHKKQE